MATAVILGAGMMAHGLAYDLTRFGKLETLTIADISDNAAQKLAEVLQMRGSIKACTVHSTDGFDEVSPFNSTYVFEIDNTMNKIEKHEFEPPKYNFSATKIAGGESDENVQIIKNVLKGEKSPEYQIISLNAGFAIYIGGKANSINEGIGMAEALINNGSALNKMNEFIEFTNKV